MSYKLQNFTSNHMITVPAEFINKYNYEKGQRFNWEETPDGLLLKEVEE